MRYLLQFLIPLLIFAGVVYLFTRQRRQRRPDATSETPEPRSDTGAFIAILALGAVVAVGTAFALQALWE